MADYDQAIKISPKFSDPYIGSKFLLAAKTEVLQVCSRGENLGRRSAI
jgi:hypothetical protein